MGRIKDTNKYPFDTNITENDYLIGTDAENSGETKNYLFNDIIGFLSTRINSLTGQDNIFVRANLGQINEGESVADVINALPTFTVTDTSIYLYTVDIEYNAGDDTLIRTANYVALLRGKGDYGVGGIVLSDSDLYELNPRESETDRNSGVVEDLVSGDPGSGLRDYISDMQLSGTTLNVTGVGSAFSGPINFSSIFQGTGLESLDEGNGIGWRLVGRDEANYGNIGLGAVDFSSSTAPSTEVGATGSGAFSQGEDNVVSNNFSVAFGSQNISDGLSSFVVGASNQVYPSYGVSFGIQNVIGTDGDANEGFSSFAGGISNTISGASVSYTFVWGANNQSLGSYGATLGNGLINRSVGATVVGRANLDYTDATGINDPLQPIFIVGIGDLLGGTPDTPSTRRDGMILRKEGSLQLGEYGSGIFTGTEQYILGVDSNGEVIELPLGSGSGVTSIIAGAGITVNQSTGDVTITNSASSLDEAPVDGTPYARQDAGWVPATGGGGNIIPTNEIPFGGNPASAGLFSSPALKYRAPAGVTTYLEVGIEDTEQGVLTLFGDAGSSAGGSILLYQAAQSRNNFDYYTISAGTGGAFSISAQNTPFISYFDDTENIIISGSNVFITGTNTEVRALAGVASMGDEITAGNVHIEVDNASTGTAKGLRLINEQGDTKMTFQPQSLQDFSIGVDIDDGKYWCVNLGDTLDASTAPLRVQSTGIESAGSISGDLRQTRQTFNDITSNYAIQEGDEGTVITTSGGANITISVNNGLAMDVGAVIEIEHAGLGTCTIGGTAALLTNSRDTLVLDGQYSRVAIQRMAAANTYRVFGQLTPA